MIAADERTKPAPAKVLMKDGKWLVSEEQRKTFSPKITIGKLRESDYMECWCWHFPHGKKEYRGAIWIVRREDSIKKYIKFLASRYQIEATPDQVDCPPDPKEESESKHKVPYGLKELPEEPINSPATAVPVSEGAKHVTKTKQTPEVATVPGAKAEIPRTEERPIESPAPQEIEPPQSEKPAQPRLFSFIAREGESFTKLADASVAYYTAENMSDAEADYYIGVLLPGLAEQAKTWRDAKVATDNALSEWVNKYDRDLQVAFPGIRTFDALGDLWRIVHAMTMKSMESA